MFFAVKIQIQPKKQTFSKIVGTRRNKSSATKCLDCVEKGLIVLGESRWRRLGIGLITLEEADLENTGLHYAVGLQKTDKFMPL